MAALDFILTEHPFTRELVPRFLYQLHERGTAEQFGAGQVIFQEGGEADRFYLIHSGRVALQSVIPGLGMTTLHTVGSGDLLGLSWLAHPYQWHLTAVAVEPVEAAALWAPTLRERMEENHDFGFEIWKRMGAVMLESIQSTRLRLQELYGYGVPG